MFKKSIFLCLFLATTSLFAITDQMFINSAKQKVSHLNQKLHLFDKNIKNRSAKYYQACTTNEITTLKSHQKEAYRLITMWIKELINYELKYDIKKSVSSNKKDSELNGPLSMLSCIT